MRTILFPIPQTADGLEVLQTLMGPGSIRLTAAYRAPNPCHLAGKAHGWTLAATLLYGGETNSTETNAPAGGISAQVAYCGKGWGD